MTIRIIDRGNGKSVCKITNTDDLFSLSARERTVPANDFDIEITCAKKAKSIEEARAQGEEHSTVAIVENVSYGGTMGSWVLVNLTDRITEVSKLKEGQTILAYTEAGVYRGELVSVESQSQVIVKPVGKGFLSDHLIAGSKIVFLH